MSRTETALREAMVRETEDLTLTISMDDIRGRARRRLVGRGAALVVAVAAVVTVPALAWPAGSAEAPVAPTTAASSATAEPPRGTADNPIRTGVVLPGGRELVLWVDSSGGLLTGARDAATGAVSVDDTTRAGHFDWVRPHAVFGFDYRFVKAIDGSEFLIGVTQRRVARITTTQGDVPLAQLGPTTVFWVKGQGRPTSLPPVKAYDDRGTLLDSIP